MTTAVQDTAKGHSTEGLALTAQGRTAAAQEDSAPIQEANQVRIQKEKEAILRTARQAQVIKATEEAGLRTGLTGINFS